MNRAFLNAIVQQREGLLGLRDLLLEWVPYAMERETNTMFRLHPSRQLRQILTDYIRSHEVSLKIKNLKTGTNIVV